MQIYFMLTTDSLIFLKNIFKLLIHTISMGRNRKLFMRIKEANYLELLRFTIILQLIQKFGFLLSIKKVKTHQMMTILFVCLNAMELENLKKKKHVSFW